jgi:hypothetical protein
MFDLRTNGVEDHHRKLGECLGVPSLRALECPRCRARFTAYRDSIMNQLSNAVGEFLKSSAIQNITCGGHLLGGKDPPAGDGSQPYLWLVKLLPFAAISSSVASKAKRVSSANQDVLTSIGPLAASRVPAVSVSARSG